jgi:hypothetical protein
MNKIGLFAFFFVLSSAIGAAPILIGLGLLYAVAWHLSRGRETAPPPPATPPPYGGVGRKIQS